MFGLTIPSIVSRVITLVIAFTVHEFSHAWVADRLGDDMPRLQGRLTLNPLAHLDPIGSLLLVLTGFGWAKPVQVDPYVLRRRNPAGMMLVSVAGPLSNLLLAIIAAIPFQIIPMEIMASDSSLFPLVIYFLQQFIIINLILLFFNIIPIAPLDGEKILEYFLPPSGQEVLHSIAPYGGIILMFLIFIGPRIGLPLLDWLVLWPVQKLFTFLIY